MARESFMNPPPGIPCVAALEETMYASSVACMGESNYSFWVILRPPRPTEAANICKSVRCMELVRGIQRVAPNECVMYDGFYLYSDILNPILSQCPKVSTPSPPTHPETNASTTNVPLATQDVCTSMTTVTTVLICVASLVVVAIIVVCVCRVLGRLRAEADAGEDEWDAPDLQARRRCKLHAQSSPTSDWTAFTVTVVPAIVVISPPKGSGFVGPKRVGSVSATLS